MSYYSTHSYANGSGIFVEVKGNEMLEVTIQGENERLITEFQIGKDEAIHLAQALLSCIKEGSKK